MTLREVATSQSQNSKTYSVDEIGEMFLGSIAGGSTEPIEIHKVRIDYFVTKNTQLLYSVIREAFDKAGYVDYISLSVELGRKIGSSEAKNFLLSIIGKVPPEFVASKAIDELESTYIRRNVSELFDRAKTAAQEAPHQTPEIVDGLRDRVNSLITAKLDYVLADEINETMDEIHSGKTPAILPCGRKYIDDTMGGYSNGEVTIIGGRPGHGKTTYSVASTLDILDHNPTAIVIKFECEMSKDQIKRKFLSRLSGVSSFKIRINELTDDDKKKLNDAAERFKQYEGRLFIFDNIYDLPSMIKLTRKVKANVCMVDHIRLMDGVAQDPRNVLGTITQYAKRYAKSHNMCWIFFSQLSRKPEEREDHRPTGADIGESDQITHNAADILLLFYRYKYTYKREDQNRLWIIFDKVRFAKINDVAVKFNPDLITIED